MTDFLFTDRPKTPATTGLDGNFGLDSKQARGSLHCDLQELQDLFLLGCWNAILIELSAVDRNAIARDLRQAIKSQFSEVALTGTNAKLVPFRSCQRQILDASPVSDLIASPKIIDSIPDRSFVIADQS